MNMYEGVPAMEEDVLAKEPLRLRGHHMGTLTWLVDPLHHAPEDVAKAARSHYSDARGDQTTETVDFNTLTDPQFGSEAYDRAYALDLVGSTEEQAETYEVSLTEALREFVQLQDEDPIELIVGGRGAVCGACTFQKHCDTELTTNGDAAMLAVFEDVTKHFASDEAPDSPVRNEEGSIVTTAKAVRQFMGYFAVGGLFHRAYYDDAMNRVAQYGEVFGGPDEPDFKRRLRMRGS